MQKHDDKGLWKERFSVYIWLIWKWRNDEVFNGKVVSLNMKVFLADSYTRECVFAFSNNVIMSLRRGNPGMT